MLSNLERWRQSEATSLSLAVALSLFFALLFWLWERELFWMLAVILPPIWSPLIYRRFTDSEAPTVSKFAVRALLVGLALVLVLGLLVYAVS